MSPIDPTEHHVRLTLHVVIPDGVYVPLTQPLSDDERAQLHDEGSIAVAELSLYLREQLAAIEVGVQSFGVVEHYTLQAPQKGITR